MAVIADTSPLNYLVVIDEIAVLHQLYGQVTIPHGVRAELLHAATPTRVSAWIAAPPPWIEVVAAPETPLLGPTRLGRGEAEAIRIGLTHASGCLLLMDDLKGRSVAAGLGLKSIGTLGVLRDAAARQFVNVPKVIGKLKQTNFRVSPRLLNEVFGDFRD